MLNLAANRMLIETLGWTLLHSSGTAAGLDPSRRLLGNPKTLTPSSLSPRPHRPGRHARPAHRNVCLFTSKRTPTSRSGNDDSVPHGTKQHPPRSIHSFLNTHPTPHRRCQPTPWQNNSNAAEPFLPAAWLYLTGLLLFSCRLPTWLRPLPAPAPPNHRNPTSSPPTPRRPGPPHAPPAPSRSPTPPRGSPHRPSALAPLRRSPPHRRRPSRLSPSNSPPRPRTCHILAATTTSSTKSKPSSKFSCHHPTSGGRFPPASARNA